MTVHGRTLQRIRATAIAMVIGTTALVFADGPQPALALGGSISVTSVTRLSTVRSFSPQVSADGRFTAFADISGAGGVRVAEAGVAGSIQVALNGQGQVANNAFNAPAGFSADGRHLVIVGEAGNLTPTDTLRRYRVYTLDRDADGNGVFDEPGFTTLRRVPGRVAAGADVSGWAHADISDSGRYVAFTQPDVDGATTCMRAYRYDRDTDADGVFDEPGATATVEVTVGSAGVPGARTGGCLKGISDIILSLHISGNGRHVAFTSDFDNLVTGDTNNAEDVFVRDVDAGTTIRVPRTTTGFFSPGYANVGGISADGRFVVVRNGNGEIIRSDRDADADGIFDEADGSAVVLVANEPTGSIPSISGDGGTISYWTPTAVKVWRPATGVVPVLPAVVNASGYVSLNASGNVLAVMTRDVYDASDVNGLEDIYRVEITGGAPVAATVSVSAVATTPPAASEIPITNISPQLVRNANFDVSAAPGGGVKRAPGGGVKRAPGGGVKRAPGGGVKRADALANYATVFSRVPAINSTQLSAVPIAGGWESRLPASLQGRPLQTITLAQVLATPGLELENLDLTNTPLANLSAAAYALGSTPLNALLINSSTGWCTQFQQLTGKACFGAGSIGGFTTQTTLIELEMRADTRELLAEHPELVRIPIRINIAALRTASAPILAETFATLGLGVSKVGDLPVATAIAATPGIGSLRADEIGNTDLILDCIVAPCEPSKTLTQLQASGQVQARARIRDFTTSINTKTLNDVAAALPADVTLNDVLIGLLEAQDFPWEAVDLVTSGLQEAAAAPATVRYDVTVQANGGTGPFDGSVEVALPAGWRVVRGTSSITPGPSLPLSEPRRIYDRAATTAIFTLVGIQPGVPYTISFDTLPGFVLGAVATNATFETTGVIASSAPRVITITEPVDAPNDANAAQVVQADKLYISYTTAPDDVDLFRFNPPAGKRVAVWLSNYERDLDLSLYGPPLDQAGASGSPSVAPTRGPAPAVAPLADEGSTNVGGTAIAEPQLERDLPLVEGSTLLGTSANADVDVEGVSAVNANLIQVAPYQGATSQGPYVLRVRLDDSDTAAACQYTRTGGLNGPLLDVNALPAGLETAVLVNQRRLGDAMGSAAATDVVDNWLAQLSAAPGVAGAVVNLDQIIDYSALDANWCDPAANNDVVRQIGDVIAGIRAARPSLRHLVIVGGDDIIPMARIDDITRTGNESEYADELLSSNGGVATPLTEALGTRHFLTDDPYGDVDPIAWFNRRLYVPDLAVGRLVETRDEIVATIQAYLDPNGDGIHDDTGVIPADATYMTGYDFMADGAQETRTVLDAALTEAGGAAPTTTANISPPAGAVTGTQMLTGAASGRAVGLFGHFSHDSALTDAGFRGSGESISPAQLAGALRPASTPPNARLVFSMGCHSGLSVTDGIPGSTDFAQSILGTGAIYVAMTSFGYGAQGTVGLNETLMTSFASGLDGGYVPIDPNAADTPANRRYVTVGEAFVAAKQRYFSSQGLYGPYDEKSLEAATFYGLPMLRIGQSGSERTAPAPLNPTPVGAAAYSAVDRSEPFAPAAVTVANGTYHVVPGFAPQVTANRPVQPRYEVDVTAQDVGGALLYAKGVLVTGLETGQTLLNVDPVVTRPVLDDSTRESEIAAGDIAYPSVPASITTYSDQLGLVGDNALKQRQKLIIIPGQFLDNATVDPAGDGTQVLYDRVDTRVTYSDSTDWERPSIASAVATLDGGGASFSVGASDAAGVQRVLVLYRTDVADWTALDLALAGQTWQASTPVPGATVLDYLVQVVDVNGNVATASGKGRGLQPFVAPVPEPALVSVVSGSVVEGDTGSSAATIDVVLDRPAPGPVTVGYTVTAGTATSGADFTASSGSVEILSGDVTAEIPVAVLGDTAPEAPESVLVTLTSISGNATIGASASQLTIVDDDALAPPNTLVRLVQPAPVIEGNAGSQIVNVPITIDNPSPSPITLSVRVVTGGTASAGTDFSGPSFTAVIPASASAASIPITVFGDTIVEGDETIVIAITTTQGNVNIVGSTAVVTIADDDVAPLPVVSVADVVVGEGAGSVDVTVSLDQAVSGVVVVPWSTQNGSASAPGDYVASSGTVTISSGSSGTFAVPIVNDAVVEVEESFTVTLGAPTGAVLGDATASVTIIDDDVAPPNIPRLSIADASVYEGLKLDRVVPVTVSIDPVSNQAVSFRWSTVARTARARSDYQPRTSRLATIPAGAASATILVRVYGDARVEPDETFDVVITPVTVGIGVADGVGTVKILDDDPQPTAAIGRASVVEGDIGAVDMQFVVTLSKPMGDASTVRWTASDLTAKRSLGDYSSKSGVVTIAPGDTAATIVVKVNGDTRREPDETLLVQLTSVSYARVTVPTAVGTIINDD